jgi:hypothetical protein
MLTSLLANQTNTTSMVHSDSQSNLGSAQQALQLKVDELEACLKRERDQFKVCLLFVCDYVSNRHSCSFAF